MKKVEKNNGFTLIELLIVISIIGLLAGIVMVSLLDARQKGKVSKVKQDLHNSVIGIYLLESDTGKWPNGCPPGMWEDPEVELDSVWAGLNAPPPVGAPPPTGGYTRNLCFWTASDVSNWHGPYILSTKDPWGNSYLFDPDFCNDDGVVVVALDSRGPDGLESYRSDACGLFIPDGGPTPGDDNVIYLEEAPL